MAKAGNCFIIICSKLYNTFLNIRYLEFTYEIRTVPYGVYVIRMTSSKLRYVYCGFPLLLEFHLPSIVIAV